MEKKKYGKPFMVKEEFVADSYVAGCDDIVVGAILVTDCIDHKEHNIEITTVTNQDIANGHADGPGGGDGALYRNRDKNIWAYAGSIVAGHFYDGHPHVQGEWMNITRPGYEVVGEDAGPNGQKYCDCNFYNTPTYHHHLIQKDIIVPGNAS